MTGTDIWRTSIVTLAFQHPFLLSALFSLSAFHLTFMHSSKNTVRGQEYSQAAAKHRLKSIANFRVEVRNLTSENSDASCACALLLALHEWTIPSGQGADLFFPMTKDRRGGGVPWYKLHRGGVEVLKSAIHWVEKGEFGDLVRPWKRIPAVLRSEAPSPVMDKQAADRVRLESVSSCWREESVLSVEDQLTLENTLDTLRYVFTLSSFLASESSFSAQSGISSCFATLLWTTIVPARFCEMVEERCPQALLIVAVYCVLLKRTGQVWWIKGKAEDLLRAVKRELGSEEWNEWLEWPIEEVESN